MVKKILVDGAYPQETRVVSLVDGGIQEIEYETSNKRQIKGNIYLAKIMRVEPSLQAAFIDFGGDKNGFLPFSEIAPQYYNIPSSDRDKLAADLHSINRPDITSNDMEDESSSDSESSEERMFSLDGEEEAEESDIENAKENLYSKYKIQDVIKKGQIILVQAQKEERGNKGASFTSYISLAGKYCVLIPNSTGKNGISRKIANQDERKRLKKIVDEMIPSDSSVSIILRTAGVKRSRYDIKRDYDYLVRLWNKVREITLQSAAPAFIHMEEDIIHKVIRDMYDHNVSEVLVDGNYAFNCAREIMHNMLPNDEKKVVEYKSKLPIFTKFGVEQQLSDLYQPVTELESGGYIVINPTEALISIDVNSGKATSERNIEETALRTNIEAAREIARQLKLRDLSGLIVVDFIDMYESKNRRAVERAFKDALSRDRARIGIGQISTFGLLEMSRQRLRGSFLEVNAKTCDHCSGKGIVRADESNAMLMLRTVEQEVCNSKVDVVNLYSHMSSVLYLLNNKRDHIKLVEAKHKIILNILEDSAANADSFSIETIVNSKKNSSTPKEAAPILKSSASLFNEDEPQSEAPQKAKKWKKSNKKKDEKPQEVTEESPNEKEAPAKDSEKALKEEKPKKPAKKTPKPKAKKDEEVGTQPEEKEEKPKKKKVTRKPSSKAKKD